MGGTFSCWESTPDVSYEPTQATIDPVVQFTQLKFKVGARLFKVRLLLLQFQLVLLSLARAGMMIEDRVGGTGRDAQLSASSIIGR